MKSRNHFRLMQKKRYDARRFHNPYFQKIRKRNWKLIAGIAGTLAIVVTAFGFLFGSPYFAIQNVSVGGAETVSSDEIVTAVWDELHRPRIMVFDRSNRFLYDEQHLREALTARYTFESLDIMRTCEWMGGGCVLSVIVQEKTSQLLWVSEDHVYLVDLQGVVIRELIPAEVESWQTPVPVPEPLPDGTVPPALPPDPLKRLPVFRDVNAIPVAIGSVVLRPEEVTNIFHFHERLVAMNILFVKTEIDRLAGKWMSVETVGGYDILFDAVGDINVQAGNLEVLLRDTVKDTSGLQYIDLRFGDHVYYK